MARMYRKLKINKTSGQVVVGDDNTTVQTNVGGDGDAGSGRELPWMIISAAAAVASAIAAVLALILT